MFANVLYVAVAWIGGGSFDREGNFGVGIHCQATFHGDFTSDTPKALGADTVLDQNAGTGEGGNLIVVFRDIGTNAAVSTFNVAGIVGHLQVPKEGFRGFIFQGDFFQHLGRGKQRGPAHSQQQMEKCCGGCRANHHHPPHDQNYGNKQ